MWANAIAVKSFGQSDHSKLWYVFSLQSCVLPQNDPKRNHPQISKSGADSFFWKKVGLVFFISCNYSRASSMMCENIFPNESVEIFLSNHYLTFNDLNRIATYDCGQLLPIKKLVFRIQVYLISSHRNQPKSSPCKHLRAEARCKRGRVSNLAWRHVRSTEKTPTTRFSVTKTRCASAFYTEPFPLGKNTRTSVINAPQSWILLRAPCKRQFSSFNKRYVRASFSYSLTLRRILLSGVTYSGSPLWPATFTLRRGHSRTRVVHMKPHLPAGKDNRGYSSHRFSKDDRTRCLRNPFSTARRNHGSNSFLGNETDRQQGPYRHRTLFPPFPSIGFENDRFTSCTVTFLHAASFYLRFL